MSLLRINPSFKDYLWGGTRLIHEYGKDFKEDILAESWELSVNEAGPSFIDSGEYKGKTLKEYIEIKGRDILGSASQRFDDFPILIKLIDAKKALSIQVHPDNEYALANEGQYGKTEMWYILDAKKDAFIYYGFSSEISKEEFEERIKDNTLLEVLHKAPVQKGDVFFIEAGTIHAIGEGILIAEIQQNSNVTYRVYDYNRKDKDGLGRQLHIDKAIEVTKLEPVKERSFKEGFLETSDYFKVSRHHLVTSNENFVGHVDLSSFQHILFIEGSGNISLGEDIMEAKKGDSFLIEAGSGEFKVSGEVEFLVTSIPEVSRQLRVGIDIGGTDTKIGLVDPEQNIIGIKIIPTKALEEPKTIIKNISLALQSLLTEKNIPSTHLLGIGIGMPGMIDTKDGIVIYSNNIPWENVELTKEFEKYFNLPIKVANDADCAALGEVVAGGAKEYQNAIMITLGTGVGSGIILDGELFTGGIRGGSECGHMVIVKDGRECTCGQKGCFEAHASGSAIIRSGKSYMESHQDSRLWILTNGDIHSLDAKMIFDTSREEDGVLEIVEDYIRHLSLGIHNLVNIFRPEVVLIGGGISRQGERLLEPIRKYLKEYAYGRGYGQLPEIRTATLGNKAGLIGAANLIKIEEE